MAVSPDLRRKSDAFRSAFLNEDVDKDGFINLSELKRALVCTGDHLTDEKLQQLLAASGKQNKKIFNLHQLENFSDSFYKINISVL